jgi:hypothetical protein
MGIRSKVLVILLGMWTVIMCVIYFYSTSTLINEYVTIEKNETVKNIDRTRKTLNNELTTLKILNGDWSKWDDAYKCMQNVDPAVVVSPSLPRNKSNLSTCLSESLDAVDPQSLPVRQSVPTSPDTMPHTHPTRQRGWEMSSLACASG